MVLNRKNRSYEGGWITKTSLLWQNKMEADLKVLMSKSKCIAITLYVLYALGTNL